MELTELNKKWGKYCDTTKLVSDMRNWMDNKRIRNTMIGICDMLDVFFTNKEELIQLLAKSKHYDGNLRIKLDTQMVRYGNADRINRFVYGFYNNVEAGKAIFKTVDSNGKKMQDYLKIGKKTVSVADLVNGSVDNVKFNKWSEVFDDDGVTKSSRNEARAFANAMYNFRYITAPTISEADASDINSYNSALKIAKGTKTSRAFNKVCTTYGVDKLPKYNKLFAEYADMVSESKRNIKFYISVNPIDYLTMSNGRSWHSCHAYNGGYFGGTVSYMLDKVSLITFVFDDVPNDFALEGKIYRNMFHYKDGVLLQSRVYPQGNDGCTNLYDEFRKFVHSEFAAILNKENKWCDGYVRPIKHGNHYPDYNSFRHTYSIDGVKTIDMDIGHTNVCPCCGREENLSSCYIAHHNCRP